MRAATNDEERDVGHKCQYQVVHSLEYSNTRASHKTQVLYCALSCAKALAPHESRTRPEHCAECIQNPG